MNNKSNILKSPTGMKAYLPRTALELKELEEMIMDNFSLWGYQPILTPTVEMPWKRACTSLLIMRVISWS